MAKEDSYISLLVYLFVISPILGWILTPGRFERKRAIHLAILFIVTLCAITLGIELKSREVNYYDILNINRDKCTLSELKKAYRTQSINYHPDKNPSKDAADKFNKLRIAFDVLSDNDKREKYEYFGETFNTGNDKNEQSNTSDIKDRNITEEIISMLTYYITWGIITYFFTIGESSESRSWIFLGMCTILAIELKLIYGHDDILSKNYFPRTTPYELIHLLKVMFPPFMNGCRVLGAFVTNNDPEIVQYLTIEVLKSNKLILMKINELNGYIETLTRKGQYRVVNENLGNNNSNKYSDENTKDINKTNNKRSKFEKLKDKIANTNNTMTTGNNCINNHITGDYIDEENNILNPKSIIGESNDKKKSIKIPRFVYGIAMVIILEYFFG